MLFRKWGKKAIQTSNIFLAGFPYVLQHWLDVRTVYSLGSPKPRLDIPHHPPLSVLKLWTKKEEKQNDSCLFLSKELLVFIIHSMDVGKVLHAVTNREILTCFSPHLTTRGWAFPSPLAHRKMGTEKAAVGMPGDVLDYCSSPDCRDQFLEGKDA